MSAPERIELARSRWWAIVALGVLTIPAAIGVPVQIARGGGPVVGKIVISTLVVSTAAYLWGALVYWLRTYFSEAGVHQPALFRGREIFLAWSEIDRVVLRDSTRVEVYGGRKRIVIAVFTFRDRRALSRLLDERIPLLRRGRPSG